MVESLRNALDVFLSYIPQLIGAIVVLIGIAWLLVQMGLPTWLGFLLVGGVTIAIGGILAWTAIQSLRKVSVVPTRTVETIKQDVEWAKDQTQ